MTAWAKLLDQQPSFLKVSSMPDANDPSIRKHELFSKLFGATPIPDHVEGFQCLDAQTMADIYPEGTEVAKEVIPYDSYWGLNADTSIAPRPISPHQIPQNRISACFPSARRC